MQLLQFQLPHGGSIVDLLLRGSLQSRTALSLQLNVQIWAIFCPSAENFLFFSEIFPKPVDIWGCTLFLPPASMLSCCFSIIYVQSSFSLLALSTYPALLCFLHCLLNPPVCFPVFLCSFCFRLLLLQISPLISEIESISGDPPLFPGCISHCCILGSHHDIDIHVIILSPMSGANFPPIVAWKGHARLLAKPGWKFQIKAWFGFLAFFRQTRNVIITRSWSTSVAYLSPTSLTLKLDGQFVMRRNKMQNATFCSPEQVYYERLFATFDRLRYCQDIHLLLCCWQNKRVI